MSLSEEFRCFLLQVTKKISGVTLGISCGLIFLSASSGQFFYQDFLLPENKRGCVWLFTHKRCVGITLFHRVVGSCSSGFCLTHCPGLPKGARIVSFCGSRAADRAPQTMKAVMFSSVQSVTSQTQSRSNSTPTPIDAFACGSIPKPRLNIPQPTRRSASAITERSSFTRARTPMDPSNGRLMPMTSSLA